VIGDIGQRLDEGSTNGSISVCDYQAIDLAVTEAFFKLMTDPRQQNGHDIIPTSIEEKTAADHLPGLRFLMFGGSPDRIFLPQEVTCAGKQFAFPCKAEPSDQFHGECIVEENRLSIKHGRKTCSLSSLRSRKKD